MQPLQSSSSNTSTGCVDKVSSRCVTWDGPEITCLDGTKLCKGQTVDYAIYNLAKQLCEVLEAVDITNYANCLPPAPSRIITIKQLFEYVIGHVCDLQADADAITNAGCPIPTADVPPCLSSIIPGNPTSLPVDVYAVTVAGIICTILAQINQINSEIDIIDTRIDDLWAALANCNQSNQPVQPTCTYDYTFDPTGAPVAIQIAYQWLESAFCDLVGVIGTTSEITAAVNKQCADLNNAPRLFGGGTMSDIPGWENSPSTVADSVGNMWLTVCDMRGALDQVLNTCCFSICNYMEFGYTATWDVDGNYVNITFIGATTLYEANATSNHTASYSGVAGGPWPPVGSPWVATDFPASLMTNIIITLSDGSNQVVLDTGQNLSYWMTVSNTNNNGFNIDFTSPAFAGYDPQSVNQTITIQFAYQVNDGVTVPQSDCIGPNFCCEIDFSEGFPYQCNSPRPSECDLSYIFPAADQISITWSGLISDTQQYYPAFPIPSATATGPGVGSDELELIGAGWTINEFGGTPGINDKIVYIIGGTGAGQCRRITSNTATVLTVAENWDTLPDATSVFYIANEYIPLPYNNGGGVSYVIDYSFQICDATGFNPADTSTWVSFYNTTYNSSLNTAASITITTPPNIISSNKNYVAVITANYNCGSSDSTFAYFLTPIAGVYQLELSQSSGTLFTGATGDIFNITSNTIVSVPSAYSVSLNTQATFPIELPTVAGDSFFNLGMNPGTLSSGTNSVCKCGLQGNPYQNNPTAPDYRGNILGNFRGYEARLEIYNPISNTSFPLLDQSAPPIQYKTNTISDPSLTFSSNSPLPPIAEVPVGYTLPFFWIKGVYDGASYTAASTPDYHNVYFNNVGSTITLVNNSPGALLTNSVGSFRMEILRWDASTSNYISYTPARVLTIPIGPPLNTNVPPGSHTYSSALVNPGIPQNYTLACKLGDALIINTPGAPCCGWPGLSFLNFDIAYANFWSIQASTVNPGPAVQYSCAGNPYTSLQSTIYTPLPLSEAPEPSNFTHAVIITENYDVRFTLSRSEN